MAFAETLDNNLMSWINAALSWLHEDGSPEALQSPHRQLLELMETEDQTRAWEYIEELEELTQVVDPRERGETMVCCARRAVQLGSLKEALRYCTEAESKFASFPHQHAVVLWMIGSIQWETRQNVKAIANWRSAIDRFRLKRESLNIGSSRQAWYAATIPQLDTYLLQAIRANRLPLYQNDIASPNNGFNPGSNNPGSIENGPLPNQPPPGSQPNTSGPLDVLKWTFVTVSDVVPAGGFGAVGFEPPKAHLETAEVMIGNELFSVHSVRRRSIWRNTIIINPSVLYRTVLVTGTSMNNSKPVRIEEGDYVFVRQQEEAADNEIVIAAILDTETLATVKRVRKSPNGTIQLLPESLDERHYRNSSFGRDLMPGRDIHIAGVVEAVFKRKI